MSLTLSAPFASAAGAWVYGFVGSLHCAAMCGPLCCALLAARSPDGPSRSPNARAASLRAVLAYSATRVLAYAALGAVAGALGQGASRIVGVISSRAALYVFAALLAAVALPWNSVWRRLSLNRAVPTRALGRLADILLGLPRSARGAFLGLATPLLPCGFLYGALAGAVASGSLAAGLVTMLAFALGTVPILVLLVVGAGDLAGRLSGRIARIVQKAVALAAAAGLLYAAWTMPPPLPDAPPVCPHCAAESPRP